MTRLPVAVGCAIAVCAGVATATSAGADLVSTTTVNGTTPPGTATSLSEMTVMLDTVEDDGRRLLVQQGIRKPGTRAPIHVHDYGGHTCVLSGTMTDFVEGKEPATISAGSCYYMPPGVAMTAANLGKEDVRLIDTFVLPPDAPAIIVVEPGWPDLKDPTG
jgi:quercetin dioxygenase-like cupin family protein